MIVIGPLVDRWIVWLSQRNRGVYEPEYRLAFMLSMLFGVFGFVGWAIGNAHHMPWIGAVACIAYVPSLSTQHHCDPRVRVRVRVRPPTDNGADITL